jgi:4-hydroxy-4-methyl-2-oxoglutarate aldolase
MTNEEIAQAFTTLTTPQLVDACIRLQIPARVAPSGIRSLSEEQHAAGLARPVRHYGSVDIFLESLMDTVPGDVLVIDNGGRLDEGCIGDLIALECRQAQLGGIVVWGAHRDTCEIRQIGIPVFSYGRYPAGPLRLAEREAEALESARFGNNLVTRNDVAFADVDGVIFVPAVRMAEVIHRAREIAAGEQKQARAVHLGQSLREQFRFGDFLLRRKTDPTYTFRTHLRQVGRNIEE